MSEKEEKKEELKKKNGEEGSEEEQEGLEEEEDDENDEENQEEEGEGEKNHVKKDEKKETETKTEEVKIENNNNEKEEPKIEEVEKTEQKEETKEEEIKKDEIPETEIAKNIQDNDENKISNTDNTKEPEINSNIQENKDDKELKEKQDEKDEKNEKNEEDNTRPHFKFCFNNATTKDGVNKETTSYYNGVKRPNYQFYSSVVTSSTNPKSQNKYSTSTLYTKKPIKTEQKIITHQQKINNNNIGIAYKKNIAKDIKPTNIFKPVPKVLSQSSRVEAKYQPKRYYIQKNPHDNCMEKNHTQNYSVNSFYLTKENPKLKYYIRCPNCNYPLNEEVEVRKYNDKSNNIAKIHEVKYENKRTSNINYIKKKDGGLNYKYQIGANFFQKEPIMNKTYNNQRFYYYKDSTYGKNKKY